jgi:hypothetical protein
MEKTKFLLDLLERKQNEINELYKEKANIFNQIHNELADDVIVDIKVDAMIWGTPRINIEIQPKSAWSYVMRMEIYKDKEKDVFSTSAGGWDIPNNALFEVNYVTNKLIKFIETFDRSLIDKIEEIESKIRYERAEYEKLMSKYKLQKEIEENNYQKINIEKYLEDIKNGKILECYRFSGSKMDREFVRHYGNRFRLNNQAISKKDLINYFKDNCYIKE